MAVTLTFCVMNLPKVQQKQVIMLKKFMCPKRIYILVLLVTIAVKIAVRAAEILQKMIDADVLVLASPVYFYSIDAQLKAVIDRTVARWLEVKNKEFYYITTMADNEKSSADTTLACFRGYADCVKGAVEKGAVVAGGVYEKGEIKNHPAMKLAYQMGKKV